MPANTSDISELIQTTIQKILVLPLEQAFWTAYAIADSPTAPTWTEQGIAEVRALTR